jgi:septal ring factor EnvC (AmiA/AmiB activator)
VRRRLFAAALLILSTAAAELPAQVSSDARLRQHAESLARIRRERDELEAQMRQMQGRARDLTEEVRNITQQTATTARVVRALDTQLVAIRAEVVATTANLVRAQDELLVKEADLRRRVIDLYRRGPLHTLEVLFSATSFTDLIARYKYLHLQTVRDRAMVHRVRELKEEIETSRESNVKLEAHVQTNLAEKAREEQQFKALELQRKNALAQVQQSTARTQSRLTQIAEDERRLNSLIEALALEAREGRGGSGVIAGASLFRPGAALDWPVQGELLYRFGRVTGANNTQTKQNGIGISAPRGTSVRAVATGRVEFADARPGYGRIIVLAHAAGDYTIYASLDRIAVDSGATVTRGQVIGSIGTSDADLGPHLHFELRLNTPGTPLRAVDPLPYLRNPGR